jgi:heavy metal translocating P-type ATPase
LFLDAQERSDITQQRCVHCNEPIVTPYLNANSEIFCCSGCRSVHQILKENNLSEYYSLRDNDLAEKVKTKEINFSYLDKEEFVSEFAQKDSNTFSMEFYLEGIHCMACLWLIEKLNEIVPNVITSRLNFSKSVVKVTINDQGKFSEVANTLNSLGYRPHSILHDDQARELKKREDHSMLIKIGIAAAASMNIMIYAISVYAGAKLQYAQYFSWISLGFATPVVFYSTLPFYKNAISKLLNKSLSIDLPISIAIVVGYIAGVWNTLIGNEINYFDSISMLVFLLLSARYLLKRAQENSLDTTSYREFFSKGSILRKNQNNEFESIHEKYLNVNDVIKVMPQDFIPVDGVLLEGKAYINASTLTGEARAVKVEAGSEVFSGTVNLSEEIIVKVTKLGEDTRIGKILKQVEQGQVSKAPIVNFADKLARYFVFIVLSLATFSFFYFYNQYGLEVALNRVVSIVIITCPCALGLATPLTFTKSLASAIKNGMIIKSEGTLESLSKVKNIFLDKTGTITNGEYRVLNFEINSNNHQRVKDIIYSLECKSVHPIARAITNYLDSQASKINVDHYSEIQGVGIEGVVDNKSIKIVKDENTTLGNTIIVLEDDSMIASIILDDGVRENSKNAIQAFAKSGVTPNILSGDKQVNVDLVSRQVGVDIDKAHGNQTPESKDKFIKSFENSAMVGDGANDALALTNSDVGIAVHGSVDVSLRAADVYLAQSGLNPIVNLFKLSNQTMKIVYRNLSFSLIYNISGAIAALMGFISPLAAAIIMPISSLTVLASTLWGTRELRRSGLWK